MALRGDAGGEAPAIVLGEPFSWQARIMSRLTALRRSQKVQLGSDRQDV